MKKFILTVFIGAFGLFSFTSATNIGDVDISFFDDIINVFVYLWSIIQTMWLGLTSLLTSSLDLISQVFSSGLF